MSTDQIKVVIEKSTVGIKDRNYGELSIYPNPTNDFLTIDLAEKHEKSMIIVANTMLNLDEFLMKN